VTKYWVYSSCNACCRSFSLASISLSCRIRISCCTSAAAGNRAVYLSMPTSSTSFSLCCGVTKADCQPAHAWSSSVGQTSSYLSNRKSGGADATSRETWLETSGSQRRTASYTLGWRRCSSTKSSKADLGCCCFQTSPPRCDQCSKN